MRLETAPDKAREVTGEKTAARLYNSIEHELELGNYSEDEADAGENALSILEERFPGVRQAARSSTDPPALSRSAGQSIDRGAGDGGSERDGGSGPHRGQRSHGRRAGAGAGRRGRSRSRGASAGGVFEGAFGFGGQDAADVTITWLRWLLYAGIAYQLLQPKGATAFGGILGGLQKGVDAIVKPVDPFVALGGKPTAQLGAQAQPVDPQTGLPYSSYQQALDTPGWPNLAAAGAAAGVNIAKSGGPAGINRIGTGPLIRGLSNLPTISPVWATGPAGSHVKAPTSPLALTLGRTKIGIGG